MVSFFARPGGARLGYVVLGEEHLHKGAVPLIFINGMSMRFQDWDVISELLSENRSGAAFRTLSSIWTMFNTYLAGSFAVRS